MGRSEGKESIAAVFSVYSSAEAFHCYAVLETEKGNAIVMEDLKSGAATREHNPKDFEYRNSAAKVLRSVDCSRAGATVQDAVKYQPSEVLSKLSRSQH